MTEFEYSYSTRSVNGLFIGLVALVFGAIGIGIASSARGAGRAFGYFFTASSAIALCFSAYGLMYPFRWSLRVKDGILEWDSPKWPKSKGAINVRDIQGIHVISSDFGDQMQLSTTTGQTIDIPKNCLKDAKHLKKVLEAELSAEGHNA